MIIKKQSIEIKKININDLKKEYIEIPIFQRFFHFLTRINYKNKSIIDELIINNVSL